MVNRAMKLSDATAILLFGAFLLPARAAWAEERVELVGQPQVVQPILYDAAPNPVASVILFAGGDGVLSQMDDAFLMRVRKRFVAAGMSVAVPDRPSDRPRGFGPLFRIEPGYVEDMAAIVDYLKRRSPAPVWAIGHSNGTISAAAVVASLGPDRIAGVVLLSSVWLGGLNDAPVGKITVPVLLIHNQSDACPASPFSLAEKSLPRFAAAHAKKFIAIAGRPHQSEPCGALSPHDFYGADDRVVPLIVAWIRAHR
jgi:predicted alpha/beta-hydrolase family hydrolase